MACLLIIGSNSLAQETFVSSHIYNIQSEILHEERTYAIRLPDSYENDEFYVDKKYPVCVVLDADWLFNISGEVISHMSRGSIEQIPEMIVVGIYNSNRNRDMLPSYSIDTNAITNEITWVESEGSANFMKFISEELLPEITKKYSTNNCNILIGHSFSGLFTINAFVNSRNFQGFIAIDPSLWWEEEIVNKQAKFILEKSSPSASIFIGQANNPFNPGEDVGRKGKGIGNFKRTLSDYSSDKVRYSFQFFEKEDHFSIPLICLYEGLNYIFDGYKFPLQTITQTSPEAFQEHYLKLSNRFGGELSPPGKLLDQVGNFLLNSEQETEKAIAIFTLNTEFYPNSYIPFQSLAEAYLQNNDTAQALKYYKNALALNPRNESVKQAIENLQGK
ncbi:alpha/beta hydrolase-fold protein [Flexithrix dorotheae]|uniref:alpha/beta hydrolase-fold protein n=1 Tax=Flexithrix dorotheae TaxID=70993 RepID=UPI00146D2BF3|nr:alpha/beta hydrolase-fold protein [Flexithrix dorotheae]